MNLRKRPEPRRGPQPRPGLIGPLLALIIALVLLSGRAASADVALVQAGASGVTVGGVITLVPARPSVLVSADQSTPAEQLGPVSKEDLNLGVAGILSVARLRVEAQAFRDGARLQRATASAEVSGLRIPDGTGTPLFQADAVRSTCTATEGVAGGAVDLLKIGQIGSPTPVAPNTEVAVPGLLGVTLNEQVRIDEEGFTQIIVRGVHIRLLQAIATGPAVVDLILAESVCQVRTAGTRGTSTPPNGGGSTVPATSPNGLPGSVPSGGRTPVPTSRVTTSTSATTATTITVPSLVPGASSGSTAAERARLRGVPGDEGRGSGSGNPRRSTFVESVTPPSEVSVSPSLIAENVALTVALILLVAFPAEFFNATVLQNYDEISQWSVVAAVAGLRQRAAGVPNAVGVPLFALVAALLYSQLSPDFGFNRGSLALVLGMFGTVLVVSLVYDVSRTRFVKRFQIPARLRAHALVLPLAVLLVVLSRLADFTPGYIYGLFTAVVYLRPIGMELDGRGLARAAALLGVLAVGGWFLWEPVQHAAREPGAGLLILALDAFLASFWVAGLGAIVFGQLPLRFFDGEAVRAWNSVIWALIYGSGLLIFLQTIAHPDRGFYGRGDVPLPMVLGPFILFGLFSIAFWGYFRFRRRPPSPGPPVLAAPPSPTGTSVEG